MNGQETERLVSRYMSGETTPDEERRLALALADKDDLPAEWAAVRQLLGELTLGEALYDQALAQRRRRRIARRIGWVAAACIAVLLGFFGWHKTDAPTKPLGLVAQMQRYKKPSLSVVAPTGNAGASPALKSQAGHFSLPRDAGEGACAPSTSVLPDDCIIYITEYMYDEHDGFTEAARMAQEIRERGERLSRALAAARPNEPFDY